MPTPANAYRVTDADIGYLTEDLIFARVANRLGIEQERLFKVMVEFENGGPDPAEYTKDELRYILTLMKVSCGEGDILQGLDILPGYRGEFFSPPWKDLVLFDGNGNYLVHDICLDEIMVVTIAKRLHGRDEHKERHAIAVLRREDLDDDWCPGDPIALEDMKNYAIMVINRNNVYQLSSTTRRYDIVKLGNVYIAEREQRDAHSFEMYISTRLRPQVTT